jgi:hypothetical protein
MLQACVAPVIKNAFVRRESGAVTGALGGTRHRFGINDGLELTVPGGVPKLKTSCTAATMIFGLRENRSRTLGAVDRFN